MLGPPPAITVPPTLGRGLLVVGRLVGTVLWPLPLLLPVFGRTLLPLLPLLPVLVPWLPPTLGRTVLPLLPLLLLVERTTLLLVAERVLLLVLMLVLTLERLPASGRLLFEVLVVTLVLGLFTTVLVDRLVTALPIDEREVELLLVTTALLFGKAVATLRLPAAAALVVDGRRPWAIAPVEVMASPHASIKPIIVL
jgi:hypothetical protein